MPEIIKSEEELKEYLENLGTEYSFSCLKEKNPEGCHLLSEYLEAFKKDVEGAALVLKTNCDDNNYPKSCVKYGDFRVLGLGCTQNQLEGYNYYKKACELGSADGCLRKGIILTSKSDTLINRNELPLDYVEGLNSLEKACSFKNAHGCFLASSLYITGNDGIAQDKAKAAEFAKIACDGGNVYACMNLSQMYKIGDGVDMNLEKSNMYKEKAREFRNDFKKKHSLGLQQYT